MHLAAKQTPQHFRPLEFIALFDEHGEPRWLESSRGFEFADIALLPGIFGADMLCPAIEEFAPSQGTILEPGLDVCLVGFPFDIREEHPFPIWKKAMIASEPGYTVGGKPFAFLDTAGRPGMSGSPVYGINDAYLLPRDLCDGARRGDVSDLEFIRNLDTEYLESPSSRTKQLEFLGLYSGSLGDASLDQLNLGRFWPSIVLDDIRTTPAKGSHPVPPALW